MKKISILTVIWLLASTRLLTASEISPAGNDTTKLRLKNMKIWVIEDNDSLKKDSFSIVQHHKPKVWAGLDLGVNGYLNSNNKFDLPANYKYLDLDYGRSRTFSINFAEKDFTLYKEYIQLVTGLGIEWNNYRFSNNTRIFNDSDKITGYIDTIRYSNSKLRVTYLNLPILLNFNSSSESSNAFHFAAGIIFGYNIGSMTKVIFENNGKTNKDKQHGDYNASVFRYGLTARVGFGDIRLFGTYQLTQLFQKDKGPELYPFSAGLSWIFD